MEPASISGEDLHKLFVGALDRIKTPQVRIRLEQADKQGTMAQYDRENGKLNFDCWQGVNYILGNINELPPKERSNPPLREVYKSKYKKIDEPKFMSLVVFYTPESNPYHVGLVIEEKGDKSIIWSKWGAGLPAIEPVLDITKNNGVLFEYFDTNIEYD